LAIKTMRQHIRAKGMPRRTVIGGLGRGPGVFLELMQLAGSARVSEAREITCEESVPPPTMSDLAVARAQFARHAVAYAGHGSGVGRRPR
jgi:hypothetical protein